MDKTYRGKMGESVIETLSSAVTEVREEEEEQEEEEAKAAVEIWKYVFGFTDMAVVKCAIELGIAEAMENHDGRPMTLPELSSTLGCSSPLLYRIMRYLVHRRVFKEKPSSQGAVGYVQTPLSRRLLRLGEQSLAALVLWEATPEALAPWHGLSARVKLADQTNPPFSQAHGEDVWTFAAAHPAYNKMINDAMASDAGIAVPAIVEGCPEVFDGVRTLVDVGGGNGTALSLLIKAFPWVHGINFDLPHVVSVAPDQDGLEHVAGDMFESVPQADAAFLKWVLHDWNDDDCIHILKNCRKAIPEGKGKVIIVDSVLGQGKDDKLEYVRLMLDMVMMVHTSTGKERTSKEWEYVLREAGFTRHTIKPIRTVQSVIEAFP